MIPIDRKMVVTEGDAENFHTISFDGVNSAELIGQDDQLTYTDIWNGISVDFPRTMPVSVAEQLCLLRYVHGVNLCFGGSSLDVDISIKCKKLPFNPPDLDPIRQFVKIEKCHITRFKVYSKSIAIYYVPGDAVAEYNNKMADIASSFHRALYGGG